MGRIIDLKNICKSYSTSSNKIDAVKDINLSVDDGEFLSIVGRSGSGKSTLMNILGCLDVPDSGSYFLNGEDVFSFSENELSKIRGKYIGFVFQGFNLIPSLNALENVQLPLIYNGIPAAKSERIATESLVSVGLKNRLHHRPFEMSGGQQQRAAIARAISNKPSIILADEPTGNLDVKSSDTIFSLLGELSGKGKTIIIITHDKELAKRTNRLVTISDGKSKN